MDVLRRVSGGCECTRGAPLYEGTSACRALLGVTLSLAVLSCWGPPKALPLSGSLGEALDPSPPPCSGGAREERSSAGAMTTAAGGWRVGRRLRVRPVFYGCAAPREKPFACGGASARFSAEGIQIKHEALPSQRGATRAVARHDDYGRVVHGGHDSRPREPSAPLANGHENRQHLEAENPSHAIGEADGVRIDFCRVSKAPRRHAGR